MTPSHLQELRQAAIAAANQEREPAAAELLGALIHHGVDEPVIWYRLGEALRCMGRNRDALHALTRALAYADPEYHGRILVRLGVLHRAAGRLDDAESCFAEACERTDSGTLGFSWMLRGRNLAAAERWPDAEHALRLAVNADSFDVDGPSPEPLLELAKLLRARGKYPEARDALLEARPSLAQSPNVNTGPLSLPAIDTALEDLALAIEAAAGKTPPDPRSAILQASREDHPAATIEYARRFLAHPKDDGHTWLIHGRALRTLGLYTEADHALHRSLSLLPDNRHGMTWISLGSLEEDRGRYRSAEEWFQQACEDPVASQLGYVWILRGCSLAADERLTEAEHCHRQALTFDDDHVDRDEAFLNLGYVLRAQRRYAEAKDAFLAALQISPEYTETKEALATLLHVEEALEMTARLNPTA